MMPRLPQQRMDKTVFHVASLHDATDEMMYWRMRSPVERLAALELLRQVMYGYDPAATRLQRVFAIIEQP